MTLSRSNCFKMRKGPAGIHLYDRMTGVNVLLDEFIPPENSRHVAPRQISIALTNICDLECPHCYAPKTRATLGFNQVVSWLDELDANGAFGVGFGGGEPTIHRQFVDLCAYASSNTGLAVTFTTHGHRLTDSMLEALKGKVHFVRVSMDGIGETYEKIRGRQYPALLERLAAVAKVGPFGINYVVNSDTISDLDSALTVAEACGASEFLLLPEQPTKTRGGITASTAEALRKWVATYSGSVRLAVSERSAEGMPTCDPVASESGLGAYVHIDANGVVKRTSYDENGIAIGPEGVMHALNELRNKSQVTP